MNAAVAKQLDDYTIDDIYNLPEGQKSWRFSMHSTIKILETILTNIVEICTIILELFGVAILVFTAVKCFWYWMKRDCRIRLDLAQGKVSMLRSRMMTPSMPSSPHSRTMTVRRTSLPILNSRVLQF